MAAHGQAFASAEHRAAQGDGAHVDGPALFVGVDQGVAALGVGQDVHLDFVGDAPASAEQTVAAFVAAVVHALPVNRQDTGQDEIQVFVTAQYFGPGGGVHRVRRTHG